MKIIKYPLSGNSTAGRPRKLPKKLRVHLTAIAHEVTWLNHFQEVFLQFNDILKQSPVNQERSEFWEFMKWAFLGDLIHRIDRICEGQWPQKKRKVNSLGAFFDDVRPHLSLLNRSNYVGATPNTLGQFRKKCPLRGDPFLVQDEFHRLNRELDRLIGKQRFFLSEGQLDRDIVRLKKVTSRITFYRNKHLAHMAVKRGRRRPPNLKELLEAIRLIGAITHKYFLLVNVARHALDFGSVDITRIFMKAWIAGPTEQGSLKTLFKNRQKQPRS